MEDKRIAIMGAGLSGLCCAFELEKYDIKPYIFEDRRQVEDRFINMEGTMNVLTRPIGDPFIYIANEFSLHLQPAHPIKRLEIFSQKSKAKLEGHMGFFTIRGRHPESLGKQIAKKLKTRINFNSKKTYEDLIKDFDIVILSTGDGTYTRRLQPYSTDVSVKIWGAIIKGHFDPTCLKVFLNNNLAPGGYVYLLPIDEENANISIATSINDVDMKMLKERLFNEINFTDKITDEFQIRDYVIGKPEKLRVGNTFFIGNCGGYIMPFLGFGQVGAMLGGLYAGRCIAQNLDYEHEMNFFKKSYSRSLILRKIMEGMANDDFDRIVSTLNTSIGKRLFLNEKIDFLKTASRLALPYYHIRNYINHTSDD